MVYYRKYRPQTISDLDLFYVREKLSAILSSKEIPHAFLFTGSKGLGKTSSARILAKAINCLTPVGIEPCNKCDVCVSITNGSNIDVLEIDAASNGGVEEMRTLRERVKFASSTLKKKVYIIDEVHMLSTGAFNALLKTLEEPPSHVVFVLATTELHKLPATVVSRTFQVQFEKPSQDELIHSLKRIVTGEKLKVNDEVLTEIYKVAEGSFRDGAKILEELALSSGGKHITIDLFEKTFHTKGLNDEVVALLEAYASKNAKEGLQTINALYESGADFKIVIEKLVDHLRGLLMLRNGITSDVQDIKDLNIDNIRSLLELANEAYGELKISVIPQLPLELMTVKYCIIDGRPRIKDEELSIKEEEKKQLPITNHQPQITNHNTTLLKSLIEELNIINKPGAALLRSAKEVVLDNETMVIITPFPIHAERLKSEKVYPDLLKSAGVVAGRKVDLAIKIS
jgi:DNA polymerase-3 subunit gamma/tau